MDDAFEILKECNLKLDGLKTQDYRFVTWIVYSTIYGCFIAGVDVYTNDNQNLQAVITKDIDRSPLVALSVVKEQIVEWENKGLVPVNRALMQD